MFLVDYILVKKQDEKTEKLSELSVNLVENQVVQISNITQAWFLGRADGAPYSRIVLGDREGNEFMLLVKQESQAAESAIMKFLIEREAIQVGSLRLNRESQELVEIPVSVFSSEMESIKASVNAPV